ncbi:MAG TPA: NrfD/PsrC family molybdoenzyme membrane anchor subunit, partial [Pyrinomonadaceae bacterium]
DSRVAQYVGREAMDVRRPEKETLPKVFYKGAHQATLDPLAARRPDGGLFMWGEQKRDADTVNSGNPAFQNTSAAALLAYDVPHSLPWDWRVSLYTWTKGVAAGAYLVAALLVLLGFLGARGTPDALGASPFAGFLASTLWLWVAPVLSGVFLAITGALLIWDLEHPERFYLIFTRPQWRSWLVKGAFIIAGYSLVLGLHFAASWLGREREQLWLIAAGLPLGVLTAVYTAYLFAQAKARDLWQNPLLPPHLLVQSLLLGAAALLPFAVWLEPNAVAPLGWVLGGASLVHLLMVWGEVTLTHPTAHARLAVWEMTRGRYAAFFWAGAALTLLAVSAPWLGVAAVPPALVGLALHEHAYVQSGQAVPLA